MADDASLRPLSLLVPRKPLYVHLEDVRFLVFGRSLPAVLFALLGYRVLRTLVDQAHAALAHITPLGVVGVLPTALYLLFCAIPVGVYLTRPRPRARDGRLAARAAALAGTTMLLFVGILGGPVLFASPAALELVATVLTTIAFAVALWGLLTLQRSLSIIPEARRLVTAGPYRLIRHPLYAAEIIAAVAMVLSHAAVWAIVALGPFVAIQLTRARFEERLLAATFADYADYASQTRRLIPGVW
jgi:protein-S-isoprenylcysteine O-methyltransferase Ste14